MKLAILGHGNVARAFLPMIAGDPRFSVAGIHSRSQPAAVSVEEFLDTVKADVLVELTTLNARTGEPAISHVQAAFARNMHVVTANKGPVANRYHDLAAEAQRRNLRFLFESAVMDGTPVFNLFRKNLPGVEVLGFAGVLNSTTNLVLETMAHGGSFEEGLTRAQRMGIAEADASNDIDGWDSAAKTAALVNVLMDARVTPHHVERQGIQNVVPAEKTIRLVSRARKTVGGLHLSVAPEELAAGDPLAAGEGTSNILVFETVQMGTFGIFSIASGVEQTAYGVYTDLLDILSGC